jgi:hypothetical protein
MVMAQVPALFLPKKKTEEKPQVKNSGKNRKKKKPDSTTKVSALFQRGIDGYKKNNGQIRSGTTTRG